MVSLIHWPAPILGEFWILLLACMTWSKPQLQNIYFLGWGEYVLSFHCCALAPLVTATGGCSPVAACRAPSAVAFLRAEMSSSLKILSSCTHMGLVACGIFLGQGSNPCSLHWQADSLQLDHQGSLNLTIYFISPRTSKLFSF